MKKLPSNAGVSDDLRSRAEKLLRAKNGEVAKIPPTDVPRLVHELKVSRIELEMQNEELRQAQAAVAAARGRYAALYDSAPVGFFTLDRQGMIVEVNLTGVRLLGVGKSRLVHHRFSRWVAPEFQEICRGHLNQVFETGVRQSCELSLLPHAGPPFVAALESMAAPGEVGAGPYCRTAVSDITTRRQAKIDLNLKERLLDGVSDSIFLHDVDGHFIYVNEAAYKDRGYGREELLGKDVLALLPPDYAATREKVLQDLLAKGEIIFESANLRKDGSVMPVEIHARIINLDERQLILSVVRDITARRQTEQALRTAAQKWRTTFDAIGDAVCLLNPEGRVLQCNRAMADLVGKPFGDILGRHCRELVQGMIHSLEGCPLERMRQTLQREEIMLQAGDRWLLDMVDPILDEAGALIGAVHLITDLTTMKRAEAALRESEERFRAIFDQAAVGVAQVELATGRFLKINQKYCDIVGFTQEEMMATTSINLTHPDDLPAYLDHMRKLQDGLIRQFSLEKRYRRKDDSLVWVNLTVSPMWKVGAPAHHHIAVVEDISARKQAEAEVRRSLDKLHQTLKGTVAALANTVETKDPYTAGHQRRVAQLASAIARELAWSPHQVEGIQVLSFLHDMGKIAVPAEILSKPGRLTPYEFNLIKAHPQVGYDILKDIDFPWPVAQAVLQHHERLNGSGYPAGLTATEIIPEAKVLAVADVVEAMASHRPYRPARGIDKALEEVTLNQGELYDPEAVMACVKLFRESDFVFD